MLSEEGHDEDADDEDKKAFYARYAITVHQCRQCEARQEPFFYVQGVTRYVCIVQCRGCLGGNKALTGISWKPPLSLPFNERFGLTAPPTAKQKETKKSERSKKC